jgi:hypothetical protein
LLWLKRKNRVGCTDEVYVKVKPFEGTIASVVNETNREEVPDTVNAAGMVVPVTVCASCPLAEVPL